MSLAPERVSIGLRRLFTSPGVDPYDEVVWERRDARISNWKDGTIAFEQRDVEFPVSWSVNATNIVAQKYFRGTLGTPERESSLRQVVDRVVDTITRWGIEGGYFVDDSEAEAFSAELKYILVTQRAAFNSPVWFNIGVKGVPQQASACQPYDALVSTPGGLVPIGELVERDAVGAKVYDASGLTSVVATKANGRKRVIRIHTKAGYTLEATPDHLVWKASGGGTGRFVAAGDLRPGDQLTWHRTESWGDRELVTGDIAEAALAGWLQGDGFVGQYDHGTNRSLTIEFMTMTDAEHEWVLDNVDRVFPGVHRHVRDVTLQDPTLVGRRVRLYGEVLRPFVEQWGLLARGAAMKVPADLFDAPLPVVAAYLRSLFQAEGSVSVGDRAAVISLDMVGEAHVRGIHTLLSRFGIFARVRRKNDSRPDRQGTWSLTIRPLPERIRFAAELPFVDGRKQLRLQASLELQGIAASDSKRLEIERIEDLGEMEVYDIQTESGEYLSSAGLRVHNCFILAVDDTMNAILNWYREEGIIFKGGSGSGVNLSKIRSSAELLDGGGTASGPVSFMRGADASAGTIKSGGKTRRAAKMVILNADHPDVEEFIWCKVKEERKARALRDAGFDMDLDGADSFSIQYQNANNSVRVTDEFMQAVIDDADWALKAVTTGEVVKSMRARDLWRQIAEAAWDCADPGLQFDTTINKWHTAHATGRINGSNPCSEYVHLDNSACNLASINLLKYLDEGESFDIDSYRHTIEMVFTAQEILVGRADYPTEAIADTSRQFRQLGLGYANLGALLMALGHAYDSPAGRAWAAALTSLMTGHAYATSARTAARMGPFAGFAANEEYMLNVLRMHRDESYRIDNGHVVPGDVVAAGQQSWEAAIRDGEEYGVRNSQATVLAPTGTIGLMMDCDTTGIEPDLGLVKVKKLVGGGTMSIVNQTIPRALRRLGYTPQQVDEIIVYIDVNKTILGAPHLAAEHVSVFACSMGDNTIHYKGHVRMMGAVQPFLSGAISKCVTGDTLLPTADGLVRIASLHRGEAPDTFRDEIIEVDSLDGPTKTGAFYYGGRRSVRRVELRSGHAVTGTDNHRLLVASESGLEWRRLDELAPGDLVAAKYGAELWSSLPARFDQFLPTPAYGNQKPVTIPTEMTEDLAFLLGAYASEGCTTRANWTVRITNSVAAVRDRVVQAWASAFGVEARVVDDGVRCPDVAVSSKTIVEFLEYVGAGARASAKRIPDAVLRSPRHMVLAFLDGLSLDAYVSVSSSPRWGICLDSPGMLDDLQAILTNLGVVHSRIGKYNASNGKTYDEVYATGLNAKRLCELVPFLEPDKAARAAELITQGPTRHDTADVIPLPPRVLHATLPVGTPGRGSQGRIRSDFAFLLDDRTRNVTRRTVERAMVAGAVLPSWVHQILDDELHLSPVASVSCAGVQEVYDVSVPSNQAFVGNGVVNHNTVNMPEEATVEEIAALHQLSWELGLKAVAIYRDNCKVGQPLSMAKKDNAAATAVTETVERIVERVVHRPVRQKLPRSRRGRTFEFRVADCKGFATVGEYDDGQPGEIFLTVSKQGSTLSGIMDAFAKSISYGLQYGVPMRAFVEAFTNMRFEPAGMTDDPDIRFASSIMDYLFRRMALEYLSYDERAELGIFSIAERIQPTLPGVDESTMETSQGTEIPSDPKSVPSAGELASQMELGLAPSTPEDNTPARGIVRHSDAPMCMQCGVQMIRAGSCHACPSCGSTSGCS